MDPILRPILELAKLNTRLLDSGLLGVNDYAARRRINHRTNNIAFLALHVVDARYYLGRYLGLSDENPFRADIDGIETIEQMASFPPIDALRSVWHDAAALVLERIEQLTAQDMAMPSPVEFPIEDTTVLAGVTFLLSHEAYHIGQIALLRKHFGLAPPKYA